MREERRVRLPPAASTRLLFWHARYMKALAACRERALVLKTDPDTDGSTVNSGKSPQNRSLLRLQQRTNARVQTESRVPHMRAVPFKPVCPLRPSSAPSSAPEAELTQELSTGHDRMRRLAASPEPA